MGEDGRRVHIVDSLHLSTGMGHLVVNAVEMRNNGKSTQEILEQSESMKKRISTSFIADNADYLYRNGRVSKGERIYALFLCFTPFYSSRTEKSLSKPLKSAITARR